MWFGTQDIHEILHKLDEKITALENENSSLRAENQRTKQDTYASEEFQKLIEERDAWRKRASRGFDISESDEKAIRAWQDKHEIEKHGLDTFDKKMKANGVSGGRYSYHFVPTAIGTFCSCRCDACGEEFKFDDV